MYVQKLHLLFLFLICPFVLLAQTRTQIKLETAERADGSPKANITHLKKPTFSHEGAILKCDSAVLYTERNFFEAFGNVHINQGDTLNIYSDFLNYDGNGKKAHLDKNVKLVDRENTLTSNILDYDMVAKIGKYTTGGKLVNKDATITSREGFYFSKDRDAYFKYNVLVVTAEKATITSDDLRYNTGTNWTYFYGPTNIKSKEDKLYTENGAYNTKSENAYFGKNNLYTNGSRSLKGDSLYYYGKQGYGKAVKNITFRDTKDQTTLWGQLGEYYRAEERIVATEKAYVAFGTKDSIMVKDKKIPDTLWLGADTLESQRSFVKDLKLLNRPVVKKDNEIGTEDEKEKAEKDKEKAEARKLLKQQGDAIKEEKKKESNQGKKLSRKERRELEKNGGKVPTDDPPPPPVDSLTINKLKLQRDSIVTDSLLKLKEAIPLVKLDSAKNKIQKAATVKGKTKEAVDGKNAIVNASTANKVIKPLLKDTIITNPADTVRARIIKAFHNVRVYKANMQAKADSLFYTSADSTLRWYKNPILWSNGTQQTGDTINVFFKESKIHNFQVLQNGFIVNVEGDSTKFNQVKGKIITGFFVEGELRNMYVDGNAESIYYSKNNKGEYDNVNQTVSSRLRFKFLEKELTHIVTIREVEGAVDPIDKLAKEALLTGFIWKPELRPTSKADIIKGIATKAKPKAKTPAKSPATSNPKGKTAINKSMPAKAPIKETAKDVKKTLAKPVEMLKLPPKIVDTVKVDTLIKQ
ncbi:OstA-like protein [Pedobacter xixiisoli]|uniref:OstA-like protein n=1 Tax=Pedobacter xixiisoli TaxID=1476464 RepID=A0A286A815_9SPHI|nr:OstA-like protein [Pedobacter xixiisoli]